MGRQRGRRSWGLTPLAIALLLLPNANAINGAGGLLLNGLNNLSMMQQLVAAHSDAFDFKRKETKTATVYEDSDTDSDEESSCPATNINVNVNVHTTCDTRSATCTTGPGNVYGQCNHLPSITLIPLGQQYGGVAGYPQPTVQPWPPLVQPGPQLVQPGPQPVQPGPQYVQPGPPLAQPGPQLVQPGPQLVQPNPQHAQPGPQYVQPGSEHTLPGPQHSQTTLPPTEGYQPVGGYQPSGSWNQQSNSGHRQSGGHQVSDAYKQSGGHQQSDVYQQSGGHQQSGDNQLNGEYQQSDAYQQSSEHQPGVSQHQQQQQNGADSRDHRYGMPQPPQSTGDSYSEHAASVHPSFYMPNPLTVSSGHGQPEHTDSQQHVSSCQSAGTTTSIPTETGGECYVGGLPGVESTVSPTDSYESETQTHFPGKPVAAQLHTGPVSVNAPRSVVPTDDGGFGVSGAHESWWLDMETVESDQYHTASKPRRPEIGEASTASSSYTSNNVADGATSHIAVRWDDERPMQYAGADIQTAFSDTVGGWERLLRPTKTAGLPALLDKTPVPPLDLVVPHIAPSGQRVGGLRLDPFKGNSGSAYHTVELESLRSDAPTKIAEDVWALVESLTLEEKIGQMSQVHIGQLFGTDGELNSTAVEYWIDGMKVGAIVDTPGSGRGQYPWYSAQSLVNMTNTVQRVAKARGSRIPVLWGLDSVRGASLVKNAAMFPADIGIAATFSPNHAYEAGRIAAKDTRAAGYQWAFAPSADIAVDKRWAQTFLSFGEDPTLVSAMVAHSVRGYQGDYKTDRQRVACCMRGFVGSGGGQPSGGRLRGVHHIPDPHLLEYHLPGFEAAIASGAAALMQAPGAVNGEALGTSPFYLRSLLRDRLHFRGVMVADQHSSAHTQAQWLHSASDMRDAVFLALNNTSVDVGEDVTQNFAPTTIDLVRTGRITEDRVTESCARILQLKKDLGLFDHPFADPNFAGLVGARQDTVAAQNAVRESLTLLRNNGGLLPLAPSDRVLFVGPHFNSTALLGGGWNVHAQGPSPAEGDVVFEGMGESIISAVRRVAGADAPIAYHRGFQLTGGPGSTGSTSTSTSEFAQLVRLARQADKLVVAMGEAPYSGQGADLGELALDQRQIALVQGLHRETRKPLAVVLVAGRPRLLKEVGEIADAVLNVYLPGAHGGLPVAEALYGKFSPSGRLPVTFPKYESQARDTMWQGISGSYAPAWPFGFGFGYSPVTYSNITTDGDTVRPGHPLTVRVTVHNLGPLDQKEPVMLYTSQAFRTGYEPELFRLRSFDKLTIKAGSAAVVSFTLTAEELAYYNRDLTKVVDPSKVNITINALTPNERTLTVNLLP